MNQGRLTVALPISSFLPNLGGAEVGLHNIASRLRERGHRPIVIVSASSYAALRRAKIRLPYEVVAFPPVIWRLFLMLPRLGFALLDRFFERIQRRFDIDVWHVTIGYPIGVAVANFARTRPDVSYIVRFVGGDIQREPDIGYGMRLDPRIDRAVRAWLPYMPRLIATTKTVYEEYIKLKVNPAHISFVTNGVDLQRFRGDVDRGRVRRELGIGDQTFLFLCVGRNHPKKNFLGLIEAAAQLRELGTRDFAVLIVGAGTDALTQHVSKSGLEGRVILHDAIGITSRRDRLPMFPAERLVELYRSADAFILPSLVESFGIVLVEAMAAGLPVITTDGPGCRDVVRDGKDAMMMPAGDVDALTDSMTRMMGDPNIRSDYASRALARANDFSWDGVVDRYIEIYRREMSAAKAVKNQSRAKPN